METIDQEQDSIEREKLQKVFNDAVDFEVYGGDPIERPEVYAKIPEADNIRKKMEEFGIDMSGYEVTVEFHPKAHEDEPEASVDIYLTKKGEKEERYNTGNILGSRHEKILV